MSSNNIKQYEQYFDSGTYDRRYPLPNRRVMSILESLVTPDSIILDFGCGSGRYLLPLGEQTKLAIGFDICSAALASAHERIHDGIVHRYRIAGPKLEQLKDVIASDGPVDLALCLFGVLAHIDDPSLRRDTLRTLRESLCPEHGKLVISVPNRLRRFRAEQRRFTGRNQITYLRQTEAGPLELTYRLYNTHDLQAELESAGFEVESIVAESLLPESVISRYPGLGELDHKLCQLLPASFGYGLLAIARPAKSHEAEL